MCARKKLPVLEHVTYVAPNNKIYWKNREAKTRKKNCDMACWPAKVISRDDTRFWK